ncbi:hypothetical protein ABZP36_011881 [Zizania latifolia]
MTLMIYIQTKHISFAFSQSYPTFLKIFSFEHFLDFTSSLSTILLLSGKERKHGFLHHDRKQKAVQPEILIVQSIITPIRIHSGFFVHLFHIFVRLIHLISLSVKCKVQQFVDMATEKLVNRRWQFCLDAPPLLVDCLKASFL